MSLLIGIQCYVPFPARCEFRNLTRAVLELHTLKTLAARMPKTDEELLTISGIKEVKREKYGQSILKTLDRLRG